MLVEYYLNSSCYLEVMIDRFKPYVLILDEVSYMALNHKYTFNNNQVKIRDVIYPIYRRSEIANFLNEIEALAQKPYRGKIMPHVISKEEMEKIKGRIYD